MKTTSTTIRFPGDESLRRRGRGGLHGAEAAERADAVPKRGTTEKKNAVRAAALALALLAPGPVQCAVGLEAVAPEQSPQKNTAPALRPEQERERETERKAAPEQRVCVKNTQKIQKKIEHEPSRIHLFILGGVIGFAIGSWAVKKETITK